MLLPASWPPRCAARMAVTLGLSAKGRTFSPPLLVMTTVLGQFAATVSTRAVPFLSYVSRCWPRFFKLS